MEGSSFYCPTAWLFLLNLTDQAASLLIKNHLHWTPEAQCSCWILPTLQPYSQLKSVLNRAACVVLVGRFCSSPCSSASVSGIFIYITLFDSFSLCVHIVWLDLLPYYSKRCILFCNSQHAFFTETNDVSIGLETLPLYVLIVMQCISRLPFYFSAFRWDENCHVNGGFCKISRMVPITVVEVSISLPQHITRTIYHWNTALTAVSWTVK